MIWGFCSTILKTNLNVQNSVLGYYIIIFQWKYNSWHRKVSVLLGERCKFQNNMHIKIRCKGESVWNTRMWKWKTSVAADTSQFLELWVTSLEGDWLWEKGQFHIFISAFLFNKSCFCSLEVHVSKKVLRMVTIFKR